MAVDEGQDKRRKMAVLGVSSILLVAMVAAVAVGVNNGERSRDGMIEESSGSGISASQRNVEMLCQPSEYRETCKKTLSEATKNTSDPKEIIKEEFRLTLEELQKHIYNSDVYEELVKDDMTKQAMEVCQEVMGYAANSLNQSINKIDEFEFIMVNQFAYDLKVWLSAVITHQRTCLDAFEQSNTDAGLKMAKVLNSSMVLSSIALDIVSGVSELAKSFSFNFRKLLSVEDGIPWWVSDSQRQLLQSAAITTMGTGAPAMQSHQGIPATPSPVGRGIAPTHSAGAQAPTPSPVGRGIAMTHLARAQAPTPVHQGIATTPSPAVHGFAPTPSLVGEGIAMTHSARAQAPTPVHQGIATTPSLAVQGATPTISVGGQTTTRFTPTISAGAQTNTPVGPPNGVKIDAVVAQDGSGQYTTLSDALKAIPIPNVKPFVIYVKAGIYKEYVNLGFGQDHVTIYGDGPTKTRFTGDKNYKDGVTTYKTATFGVNANYFTAKDIGFENTAGPTNHQAVALRVTSDYAVFHNCQFDGYQDTLYVQSYRQFFRDCTITGTIDFVFGAAAAVFQNCKLVLRRPLDNQQCVVLAGGREKADQTGGLVMQNCHFTADQEFLTAPKKVPAYMGRPWRAYARTVIMDSQLDNVFENEGYQSWIGTLHHETCEFMEYKNKGAVADSAASRVKWPGVKQITVADAMQYYPQRFFELYRDSMVASATGAVDKDQWILNSGVPYSPGPM